MKNLRFTIILILLTGGGLFAQSQSDFQSLIYPRSLSSQGLGEQGVASRNPVDAMQYNPANLTYENGLSLSFYRNPWQMLSGSLGLSLPLESFNVAAKINNIGNFAFEYASQDFGRWTMTTAQNPDSGTVFHSYQQSFAGGYAMSLNDEIAVGAQLRYVREPLFPQGDIDHLLVSAGIGYKPDLFDNRLNFGVSLMNFGTRINYASYTDTVNGVPVTYQSAGSPPASLNIGMEALPLTNDFFDMMVMVGVKKPITNRGNAPDYLAESSFSALFDDWKDFPNDVTGQIGFGLLWHPIYLGGGVSYFQEIYLGYFSTGPKDIYNSFYTHGIDIGVEAYGIKASLGYAGRWHNNNAGSYATWDFPWETFQFSLSSDGRFLQSDHDGTDARNSVGQIVVSGGFGYGVFLGKFRGETISSGQVTALGSLQGTAKGGILPAKPQSGPLPSTQSPSSYSLSPGPLFSLCSDFYFNDDEALTTSFAYNRMKGSATINFGLLGSGTANLATETFTVTSGLGIHPVPFFHPFFVQGDIGIVRRNPIIESSPRYDYKTITDMMVGALAPVFDTKIINAHHLV